MHIKSLKVFCDVVGKRSFSRAADENGISQSGASQMVHQLEDHLGVRLINRSKRPLVLTQRGHSAAVVLDVGEYQRMLEELDLLRDIHAAEKQLAEGEGIEHEQARRQVVKALGE